ncbi:MAG TPA: hypothetical protein VGM93_15530, partial [Acidimicrobiales bacterium]
MPEPSAHEPSPAPSLTLPGLLAANGAAPHDPAWTTADGEVTTYGQLTTGAGRIAAVLAERGVQRGDR